MRVARLMGLGLLALAMPAGAQEPEPTLHEYVAPPRVGQGGGGRILDPRAPSSDPSRPGEEIDPRTNPSAIKQGDKLVVEPPKQLTQKDGEPIFGTSIAPDRETTAKPDRDTRADGTLHYAEVFNPSIVPFKRMSALDAVNRDYTLYVHDPGRVDLPVGGDTMPDRDLFYGSMMIDLAGGRDVAIPSVAPGMRILSYEAAPLVDLVFSVDGADNYFVRSADRDVSGQFRLVFLVDAPAVYFAPSVPEGYSVADVAVSGGPPVRLLPRRVRETASRVLELLRLSRGTPLDEAVDTLVRYFRAFEAGEPPPSSGDLYWDLTTSQRGVCRHRAFAFTVTANALGIPTRYVTNEAHAFVELWVPERGWLRIDLGGAALELEVTNAEGNTMHRPRSEDPFPKPPAYSDNYTQLRGDIEGLTEEQKREARTPLDDEEGRLDPRSTDPLAPAPRGQLPRVEPSDDPALIPTQIRIDAVDTSAFRGETMRVSGKVRSDGRGAVGLPVDIYLSPVGSGGEGARRIGSTVSGADGSWSVALDLPADLEVGRHEVFAHTRGDAKRAAALSD